MASIKMKFRAPLHQDKVGMIYFQIIHRRLTRQIATSYRVNLSEWNVINRNMKTPDAARAEEGSRQLTSMIQSLQGEYRLLCRIVANFEKKQEPYSSDSIVSVYRQMAKECSWVAFMQSVISEMQRNGQYSTARNYQSALNSFSRFLDDGSLLLDQIDAQMMRSYEAWLKVRGVCRNTSSFYMRILRAVYSRAVEKGLVEDRAPFRRVYTGVDKTRKRAVGIDVIKAIRQLDLTHSRACFARDMFVLSFCLRGISFVDLAKLRKADVRGGYLYYTRSKTRQSLSVKWEPIMQEMVERYQSATADSEYLFPILRGGVANNKSYHNVQMRIGYHLKRIACKLGLTENLTLYVARHSWASIARDSCVPMSVISEALGHDSEQTTRIYLQSIQASEVDKANAQILRKI